jgi:hypothetical protein
LKKVKMNGRLGSANSGARGAETVFAHQELREPD